MEIQDLGLMSLEASASLFIFVLAIKLYKCKLTSVSSCFGDKLHIETSNSGADTTPMDGVLNKL